MEEYYPDCFECDGKLEVDDVDLLRCNKCGVTQVYNSDIYIEPLSETMAKARKLK